MKRLIAVAVLAIAAAAQTGRTDLTDPERLELLQLMRERDDLMDKMNAAQRALEAWSVRQRTRLEEMRKAHKAEGCQLTQGFAWSCESVVLTGKKK